MATEPPPLIAVAPILVTVSGRLTGLESLPSSEIVTGTLKPVVNVSFCATGGTSISVMATLLVALSAPPVPVLPLSLVVKVSVSAPV